MNSFPAFLNLRDRKVVITGGGEEALRKARLLASAGADLWVIAQDIDPAFEHEFGERIRLLRARPARLDFNGAVLAVIADVTDEEAEEYAKWARRSGALVNVVDRPALCDFTTPSIIDRGDVVVAISTGGAAPVLGQQIRGKIEALLPARLGDLASLAKSFRDTVRATVVSSERRVFWRKVFDGPVAARMLSGDDIGAREAMIDAINRPGATSPQGVVHIVGAGPGDPELLTMKAHRLIQEADVILYDRLVSAEIMTLARRDADRIFVGKEKANHAVPQDQIEQQMIELARTGKTVVRLKGGDPFIFGRGGEELDTLRSAGIEAFVTPGVTAATGCAANVGMALTHRDYSQAVTFVTGHAKDAFDPDIDWTALAALKHTLVVYMGVTKAQTISDRLIAAGLEPETPVAVIENGSRTNQRLLKGDVSGLGSLVSDFDIKGPAILVIGKVASLADDVIAETALQPERLSA